MKHSYLLLFFGVVAQLVTAQNSTSQGRVYPVHITLYPGTGPQSVYLSDYIGKSGNSLHGTIHFKDQNYVGPSNESFLKIALRIRLEGNGIKIYTNPNFRGNPLELQRGEMIKISGTELEPYFNPSSYVVEGIAKSEIDRNGKLPEGVYNICIEVLEFRTGIVISNLACTTINMQLLEVPFINEPRCGTVFNTNTPQNITFQWRPVANSIQNEVEYQLFIDEITDLKADPEYALQNGKTRHFFTSPILKQNQYIYTVNDPQLIVGRAYVFRIKAIPANPKTEIKNNGFSRVCHFYYGYPVNGNIQIISPKDSVALKSWEPQIFKWNMPDNLIPDQRIAYKIKIVPVSAGQDKDWAIENNTTFFEQTLPEGIPLSQNAFEVTKKLERQKVYAWQVYSYTQGQETARSKVEVFKAPPIVDFFLAGYDSIHVLHIRNPDLHNFAGRGKAKINAKGKVQEFDFSNLSLKINAGDYVMQAGHITVALEDTSAITLTPLVPINETAYFHPSHIRFTTQFRQIYGYVRWPFPHATEDSKTPNVYSVPKWVDYHGFDVSGNISLASSNHFHLLEPFGYSIFMDTTSLIFLNDNSYRLVLHGNIGLNTMIKSHNGERILLPFKDANQFYTVKRNKAPLSSQQFKPVSTLGLHIQPVEFTLDLSETSSPGKRADNKAWKGIYFENVQLIFLKKFDALGQMDFKDETKETVKQDENDSSLIWCDEHGLSFRFRKKFEGYNIFFNTFPSSLSDLKIDMIENTLRSSYLNGTLIVPFISETKYFYFNCPLTSGGLRPGYIDELQKFSFVFNPGKESEKLNITIEKAVFAGRNRLDMSITVEWPFLGITASNLTGFSAWGNYHIGFFNPNGTRYLEQQLYGHVTEYPYTAESIGAGRSQGAYSIGFMGTIFIGDDIAGDKGSPKSNMYSIVKNKFVPENEGANTQLPSFLPSGGAALSPQQQIEFLKKNLEDELYKKAANAEFEEQNQQYSPSTYSAEQLQMNFGLNTNSSPQPQPFSSAEQPSSDDDSKTNVQKIFHGTSKAIIKYGVKVVIAPIDKYVTKAEIKIDSLTNKLLMPLNKFIDQKVHKICDSLAVISGKAMSSADIDLVPAALELSDIIAESIRQRAQNSVRKSLYENLRDPLKQLIRWHAVDGLSEHLQNQLLSLMESALQGNATPEDIVKEITRNTVSYARQSGETLLEFVKPENMSRRFRNTVEQALKEFMKPNEIMRDIRNTIVQKSDLILTRQLENFTEQKLNYMVQNTVKNIPGANMIPLPGIQLNFNNLSQKLKEGDLRGIVSLDPTSINLNNKHITLQGYLRHEKNERYGNVWRGAINAVIKKPKEINIQAIFLSGKKDNYEYWFCQISPGDTNNATPGGMMSKEVKPLNKPVDIGPVQIVAMMGRIYRRMREVNHGTDILPDPSINCGAFLGLVLYDAQNKGKTLRLAMEADFVMSEDEHIVIDFKGNLQCMSTNVSYNTIDKYATIQGDLRIYYSSREQHFLLAGGVVILKPGTLCGDGSLLIETKPGYFRLEIGTKNRPIKVVPVCAGWGAFGWINADNNNAEIGVGIGLYFMQRFGFDIEVVKGAIIIDAGVELSAWANFQHSPEFKLNRVGVKANAFVGLLVDYDVVNVKSGTIELASIGIILEGIISVNPKPSYLQGNVKATVCFLRYKIKLDTEVKKNV